VLGVDESDHDQRDDVVDHHDGEQERPQAFGEAWTNQRQGAQGEGGVGGHRHAPPARRRVAARDHQVQGDGPDHPADAREYRGDHTRAFAQLAHVELPASLQPDHEEEQRHQPAVDPLGKGQRDPVVPDVDRQGGMPHPGIPGRIDAGPDQRGQDGYQQSRGARGLGTGETRQRRLRA